MKNLTLLICLPLFILTSCQDSGKRQRVDNTATTSTSDKTNQKTTTVKSTTPTIDGKNVVKLNSTDAELYPDTAEERTYSYVPDFFGFQLGKKNGEPRFNAVVYAQAHTDGSLGQIQYFVEIINSKQLSQEIEDLKKTQTKAKFVWMTYSKSVLKIKAKPQAKAKGIFHGITLPYTEVLHDKGDTNNYSLVKPKPLPLTADGIALVKADPISSLQDILDVSVCYTVSGANEKNQSITKEICRDLTWK